MTLYYFRICNVLFLILAFSSLSAQDISLKAPNSYKLKNHSAKVNSLATNMLINDSASKSFEFPVQLSLGYGYVIEKFDNGYKDRNYRTWNLGLDINLYNKVIFLTVEYGEMNMITNKDKSILATVGPKIRYLRTTHHNLFVYAGVIPSFTVIGGLVVSSKYLYSFDRFVGASAEIRYMMTGNNWWIFMAGIQIFTN